MYLCESNPCESQKNIMESLGFELKMTEAEAYAVWSFKNVNILLLQNDPINNISALIDLIIVKSKECGREEIRKGIKDLLDITNIKLF